MKQVYYDIMHHHIEEVASGIGTSARASYFNSPYHHHTLPVRLGYS
jgi:hypothetical protein